MYKICTFLLVIFCGFASQAQVNQAAQDTVKTGFSIGKVQMKNPKSILSAYTYDPITDRYIYTNSVDGFSINYPIILTPKEYEKLVLKESMRDYFKKRWMLLKGKKKAAKKLKKIYCQDIT
jgi:hypothetical protein